jgi:hypothetical protein
MPDKHNADRRHHIPKMAHRVTNWPEYEASLRSLEIARNAVASAGQGPENGAGSRSAVELAFTAEQSFVALVALDELLAPSPGIEQVQTRLRVSISTALAELDDLLGALGPCLGSPGRASQGDFAQRLCRFDAPIGHIKICHRGICAPRGEGINGAAVTAALRQVSRAVRHLLDIAEIAASSEPRSSLAVLPRAATPHPNCTLWEELVANTESIWLQHAIRVALAGALSVELGQHFTPNSKNIGTSCSRGAGVPGTIGLPRESLVP